MLLNYKHPELEACEDPECHICHDRDNPCEDVYCLTCCQHEEVHQNVCDSCGSLVERPDWYQDDPCD